MFMMWIYLTHPNHPSTSYTLMEEKYGDYWNIILNLIIFSKVICYYSYAWEPYRPDANDFPPSVLGYPVIGWPEEGWLDKATYL